MLTEAIEAARACGHQGVAVVDQGNSDGAHFYVAFTVHRSGTNGDPRSWSTHPTVEAALADLLQRYGSQARSVVPASTS